MYEQFLTQLQQSTKPDYMIVLIKNILLAVIGTGALALSAKTQIPFWPVPITMSSFTVIMIGALYGPRLATATLILYLFEGIMGLPVFAYSSLQPGFSYFMGPTGGYLMGYVFAAAATGYLSQRGWGKTVLSAGVLFFTGLLIIEILGAAWLAYVIGFNKAVIAIKPYQFASIIKIGLGMSILPLLYSRFRVK